MNIIIMTVSEETRRKRSLAVSGEKNYFYGKHYTGEKNHMYGKHHSPETKQILSEKATGKPSGFKGKKMSEEQKEKLRLINTIVKTCECGWSSETGEPHLCHCGCNKTTPLRCGRGPYPPHFLLGHQYIKLYGCWRCKGTNWFRECRCGLGHIVFKRKWVDGNRIHTKPNDYDVKQCKRHHENEVNPNAWKDVPLTQLKAFFYVHNLVPRPEYCQFDSCNRPAQFFCLVDHDEDKRKRRDPSIFKWLCKPHWFTNKDG